MSIKITFLGANRQVTGSRYCLEAAGHRVMIDCGLVQEREFLSRNWERCPIPEDSFDALLLTHVHLDHCGLIPKLVREGFDAPIYATRPSVDLARIMLLDAAKIQEEDAEYKKRRHKKEGRRGKHPEIPLYTTEDAENCLPLFRPVSYREPLELNDVFTVTYHDAGHILGSAILEIRVKDGGDERTVVFSGDLGQWSRPLVHDPSLLESANCVIMESTYGDRDHLEGGNIEDQLEDVITRTIARRGNVVIPVFAVDRAQQLMYHLSRLVHSDRIPDIPIFLDSPMAIDVTEIYRRYPECLDEEAQTLVSSDQSPLGFPGLTFSRTVNESKAINQVSGSSVIMSTAGMCTAGRIKHHLRNNLGSSRNTILFVGFQGRGTLGRIVLDGAQEVRIHGKEWRVKAEIAQIHGVSAHADRSDLLRWLTHFSDPPSRVFLTHGEEEPAELLAAAIAEQTGWPVAIPEYREEVELP